MQKLFKAKLIRRYKRFFADAELESGEIVTAHCPNTGSMKSCSEPNSIIWLSHSSDPKRKLKWTWQLTQVDEGFIGVNTAASNHIVKTAIEAGKIAELRDYSNIKSEVKYGREGKSRIDLLLTRVDRPDCYVEVKNVTFLFEGNVQFPDAVTERGLKHICELEDIVTQGKRGVMFFLVNRPDGRCFRPADHVDPEYGKALRRAVRNGVEALAYRVNQTLCDVTIGVKLTIEL